MANNKHGDNCGGHIFMTAADCSCGGNTSNNCNVCDGGLAVCKICGGAEGSLPSHCPGVKMTPEQESLVFDGKLDYIVGQWISQTDDNVSMPVQCEACKQTFNHVVQYDENNLIIPLEKCPLCGVLHKDLPPAEERTQTESTFRSGLSDLEDSEDPNTGWP